MTLNRIVVQREMSALGHWRALQHVRVCFTRESGHINYGPVVSAIDEFPDGPLANAQAAQDHRSSNQDRHQARRHQQRGEEKNALPLAAPSRTATTEIFVRRMSRLAKTDLVTRFENVACKSLATGAVDAGHGPRCHRFSAATKLIGMLDVAAFAASVASLLAVAATGVSSLRFCEVLA